MCAAISGCGGCGITDKFARLDDHRVFANRVVETSATPSPLRPVRASPSLVSRLDVPDGKGGSLPLEQYLDATRTAAFVVLRDDRIVYERYALGFDERSMLNSFSIAKAIMANLVGIAVAEGHIASLDAQVADFRPELAGTAYGSTTLKSLLTMTSGVTHGPALWERMQYYFGHDLLATAAEARQGDSSEWRYSESDIEVLGLVLEAAVRKPVSEYLSEKLWKPLGMESPALWALDRPGGREKAFCCISAHARDFARFGLLHLNAGNWHGKQIVPEAWAARTVLPGTRVPDGYIHRHLWWVPGDERGDFYAYGHNGQYVYVNPEARVVIVKFSEMLEQDPVPMFRALGRALGDLQHFAEATTP